MLLELNVLTVNGYLGTSCMEMLILTPKSVSEFLVPCCFVFNGLFKFFSQHFAKPPSEVERPSSLSSCPLKTDETIALVTEKVRKMDAR